MEFIIENEVELPDQLFDARYHPDCTKDLIAAVSIAGNVHLIEAGEPKSILKKHHKGSPIRKVRFDEQGRMITVAKTAKIHDLVSNETVLTLRRDDDKTTTFYSVKPFGSHLVCAGDDDGSVFIWDTRTPEKSVFSSSDCEQYISDIDGKFEGRKLMVCTSGEGTLTAYDLRAMKMIEPQSELFEAGFQCLKMIDTNKKVVIGGEDGAVYVFNQGEWAHTSGKFAVSSDLQNRGKCSIDCLDVLPDGSTFLVGCSDGRIRSLTLWPHQLLSEKTLCKRSSLESIHVRPIESSSNIVVSGENYLNIVRIEDKSDADSDNEDSNTESSKQSSAVSSPSADENHDADLNEAKHKKLKTDTEDYLNVFH